MAWGTEQTNKRKKHVSLLLHGLQIREWQRDLANGELWDESCLPLPVDDQPGHGDHPEDDPGRESVGGHAPAPGRGKGTEHEHIALDHSELGIGAILC